MGPGIAAVDLLFLLSLLFLHMPPDFGHRSRSIPATCYVEDPADSGGAEPAVLLGGEGTGADHVFSGA